MCGIAGIVSSSRSVEARRAAIERMCAAMVHRGPDDVGYFSSEPISLGMRRLAIFDPANGHQPMTANDGRYSLIFNGAIYNFRALRETLINDGFDFKTNCDTEVLLAACIKWGDACVDRLRGMFAFAFWDSKSRRLLLARDPFGIKPLFYAKDGPDLFFASELNALRAGGVFPFTIDSDAIAEYLSWLAVPAPRTIFHNVFSLLPGQIAVWKDEKLELRSSWGIGNIPLQAQSRSHSEFLGGLRAQLSNSIQAHMLADVPVGAFLSGGLDSAVITGLMAKISGSRLKTFSIGFEENRFSEHQAAEQTAAFFGTEHHAFTLSGKQVASDIESIVSLLDQPTGDGINTYYVSKFAREGGVTVALSGLGGDELFGGYPSFNTLPRIARALPLWNSLPDWFQTPILTALQHSGTRGRKLGDFLLHAKNIDDLCALQRRVHSTNALTTLLHPDLRTALDPLHPRTASFRFDLRNCTDLNKISAWELHTYMADVLLRDSDFFSMCHSLELRVPFIDRPLIEWLWSQPRQFRFNSHHPKRCIYEALEDVLPPSIKNRQKWGFTLPMVAWTKNDLRPFLEDTFSTGSLNACGYFDVSGVQKQWAHFLSSSDSRDWSRIWSLAVLIAFVNRRKAL